MKKEIADDVTNAELARMIAEGFSSVDARFESVDARFASVDKRFNSIDKRFASIDKRFDSLEKSTSDRFREQKSYMDRTFATEKDIDQKLSNQTRLLTKSMDRLAARLEKKIARVKRDVDVAMAGAKKRTTSEHKKVVKDYGVLAKRVAILEAEIKHIKSQQTA